MADAKPLEGLRVLDTTDHWGELTGRLLAELGAETLRPDLGPAPATRTAGAASDDLFRTYRSVGKRLGPARPDRDQVEALLAWADVWLDSGRPGDPSPTGLQPADVLAAHPHLVITSITPFGHTGPYADWEATDGVLDAASGMMFKAGVPEKPPLLPPSSLSNDVGSITATLATLAAYWQKLRTGHGQHIDLSLMDAAAQTTDWSLPGASAMRAAGMEVPQVRNGTGIYGVYPCRDGYIRLVCITPPAWRAMRAWLGEPDYLQELPKLDGLYARAELAGILEPLYRELFAPMTKLEAAAEGQRRGIAVTPVLVPEEVLQNPHMTARGLFPERTLPDGRRVPLFGGFFEVDGVRQSPADQLPPVDPDEPLGAREEPVSAVPEPTQPLAGVRVMDFGIGGVGVEGGRLLAELGADVIKIETRTYPDFIRTIAGTEMNPSFASSSRSKRSFGVNLKTAEGLDVSHQLMRHSDVIIENLSTGAMDALHVGYEDARAANPGIVMVSSQLLGSYGPWAKWIGYGPSTQPVAGLLSLWDYDDDEPPAGNTTILPDHLAGRVLAVGAVAGLIGRHRSGVGSHIEVAQVEVATSTIGDRLLGEALQPGSARPQGNRRLAGAPWGAYPCAGEQQWCVITVRDDEDWRRLKGALGDPAWAEDGALDTAAGRRAAHDRIDDALAEWTRARTKAEVAEVLQGVGVPAAPMLTGVDQLEDPQMLAHGYPFPLLQQDLGPITFEGPCYFATGMPHPVITQAPRLGEHTRDVCRDVLGLSAEETERLLESRALEDDLPAAAVAG